MQNITSKDNLKIKHIIKLKEKKYRLEFDEFIIEGIKIVEEALNENVEIKDIVIINGFLDLKNIDENLKKEILKRDYIEVSYKIFKSISTVDNPQGILAIVRRKTKNIDIDYSQDIILALDDIQDPGNLGTIIRTADSVGLHQIIISKGTADVFNPKVIRSTMGAIFRVNIIECESLLEKLKQIKKNDFEIITTSLKTDKSLYDINLKKKVIVVGNEANGVSEDIISISDKKMIIPMLGKTESLNVSVATGVILYEYVRQKYKK